MDYCYCDGEGPTLFNSRTPVARKSHQCYECGCTIEPGKKYVVHSGLWEGDFETYKFCSECWDVVGYVQAHVPCFCWTYGSVFANAHECMSEVAPDIPGMAMESGRLLVTMRRRIKSSKERAKTKHR